MACNNINSNTNINMEIKSISVTTTQKWTGKKVILCYRYKLEYFPYGTPNQVNKTMDSADCIIVKTTGTSEFKYFDRTFEKDAMIQSM